MKTKLLILFIILCAATALLLRKEVRREEKPEQKVYHDHNKATAYTVGFQRGYLAFLKQFGDEFEKEKFAADLDLFVKVEKYTVDSKMSEEESEEESQGYVDGYHRACDIAAQTMSCTRP
jgi:hypothetical protein